MEAVAIGGKCKARFCSNWYSHIVIGVFLLGHVRVYLSKGRCVTMERVTAFCASRNNIVGNTKMVLESKGLLEKVEFSSFNGYTDG